VQIRKTAEDDVVMVIAACLYAKGMKQKPIAEFLGASQPRISRLLEKAEELGWIGERLFTVKDPDIWQVAQGRIYSTTDLLEKLQPRDAKGRKQLNRITLLETNRKGRIDADKVDVVRALFGDAGSVGVTWGGTLSNVIDALRQRALDTRGRERSAKITFVPLCGEPMLNGTNPSMVSSSVLAMRLSGVFNSGRDSGTALSIAGVPAYIPLEFVAPGEVDAFRRLFSKMRGHAQVFGTRPPREGAPQPLADKLDAIFTSVGRVDSDRRGIFLKERVQTGDISEADLERTVAGDIGGVIIPKKGIGGDDLARIERMNENWMGMRLEHLQHCADAARSSGFVRKKPGVIVLAFGAGRLEVVLRCVELGLVSELVIDKALEEALRDLLLPGTRVRSKVVQTPASVTSP